MHIISSIVLGIVEGVTEFLPISSTAHMMIAAQFLGLDQTDFLKTFEIVIQLGAILAVIVLFWKRLQRSADLWKKVLAAFIPTGIIGLILYKLIKNYLLGNLNVALWALLIGGVILWAFELWYQNRIKGKKNGKAVRPGSAYEIAPVTLDTLTYGQAAAIGTAQAIAVIPGVSRSGATIVSGMIVGLSREDIVDFSFLLAIPTMIAATGYDLVKSGASLSGGQWLPLVIGFIVAFIAALASVRWLLSYVRKNNFIPFAIYRIALALILLLILR